MLSESEFSSGLHFFSFLKNADEKIVNEFKHHGFIVSIPAGNDVFVVGERASAIALIIKGSVRVYIIGETGREITLYRFGSGESCVLTANAILNDQEFPAIAHVERDTTAVMIPDQKFRDWIRRYDIWRDFVFDLLSKRLYSMMAVVNEVVFRRMDQRIATYLVGQSKASNPISTTHQQIAAEIGTSREVVSRLLESFQEEGFIQVSRGSIEIVDHSGLAGISEL